MTAWLWLPPLIKAVATGLIVVVASVMAEVLGPFWGALVASLPIASGPTYLFLTLRQGEAFVAASALVSCATNGATGLFLIVYALVAIRTGPWRSLAAAMLAWVAGCLAVRQVAWTVPMVVLLNLIVYCGGPVLMEAIYRPPPMMRPVTRRRWFDLPVRAVAVAAFVSLVVALSAQLGPGATGIVAAFPISFTSLIVIVRARLGGVAASALAANALRPMLGFGATLLTLHLTIERWGAAAGLSAALTVSLLWAGALLLLRRLRSRPGVMRPSRPSTSHS